MRGETDEEITYSTYSDIPISEGFLPTDLPDRDKTVRISCPYIEYMCLYPLKLYHSATYTSSSLHSIF